METNSNNFTPEQSLELIGQFILNYRKNLREKSFYFLIWGWLITLASISHFVILKVLQGLHDYEKIGLFSLINWCTFTILGLIITVIHSAKESVQKSIKSHLDKFIKTLWQFTALVIFMNLFFCIQLKYFFPSPFILSVVGLATIVTGITVKYRPVIFGGIAFFIFAFVSSFISNEYQLLINAVALITGYLIPGYMLRAEKQ